MGIYVIPKSVQRMWDEWNLRAAVLLSLWLQILLIFLAGWRKRTGNRFIIGIVWFAYLMADWVAAFAIGLIINNQSCDCKEASVNDNVAAFWASFLLLHLGGPDSITSMVLYVLLLAIPNPFWIPSALVFLAGTMKYVERTVALYQACFENRKKLEHGSRIGRNLEELERVRIPGENSDDMREINAVLYGYRSYMHSRALIDDYNYEVLHIPGSWHLRLPGQDAQYAFKITEVELNFIYEELFTKMGMLHGGCLGYFLRVACSISIAASFLICILIHSRKLPELEIHRFDIGVTYTLLVGAIILDFVALTNRILSDWTIGGVVGNSTARWLMYVIRKKISVGAYSKRWSENIYQHNINRHWLKKQKKPTSRTRWLDFTLDYLRRLKSKISEELMLPPYVKCHGPVGERLKDIIVNHIQEKVMRIHDDTINLKKLYLHRHHWGNVFDFMKQFNINMSKVVKWSLSESENLKYGESVMLWHTATELLYHEEKGRKDEDEDEDEDEEEDEEGKKSGSDRKACKILSDYLLYLMTSTSILIPLIPPPGQSIVREFYASDFHKLDEAFASLLADDVSYNEDDDPERWSFGLNPETTLGLTKELLGNMKDKDHKVWKMMKQVWLDLLFHGAIHSATQHLKHLTRGGEFIIVVWFLATHFGCIQARAELMKD